MNVIKTLWASVQNDPALMRRVNGWLTVFWVVMIPLSYYLGWLDSVIYVSALSLWALVSGHWSAWQAARVEVRQEEEMQAQADKDLPGEIVDRLVEQTTLDEAGVPTAPAPATIAPEARAAHAAPAELTCPCCGTHLVLGIAPGATAAQPAGSRG